MKEAKKLILPAFTLAMTAFCIKTMGKIDWNTFVVAIGMIALSYALPYFNQKQKLTHLGKTPVIIFDVLLSLLATFIVFKYKSQLPFDDAGFTLRYLDNFEKGFFYTFNPSDGPVYGISSFTNTVLCALPVVLHILSPQQALLASNFLGTAGVSFLILLIIGKYFDKSNVKYALWALVFAGTKMFLNITTSGIETPFHIAIMLLVMYFMLNNHFKAMLFTGAFSIVTKLDVVPVIGVIYIFYLIKQPQHFFPLKKNGNTYLQILLFFVLPLLIWVLVASLIFGSPLPQSANAKVHFYQNTESFWFPFLTKFLENKFTRFDLYFFVISYLLLLFFILKDKLNQIELLVPGTSFIAALALYYFYNPAEKMMWYYALPAVLMMLHIAIAVVFILHRFTNKQKNWYVAVILIFILGLNLKDVKGSTKWLNNYLNIVEDERQKIGEYLGSISKPDDILMSGHGLTSRYFNGYVLDISGLNNVTATNYQLNKDSLIHDFQPDYIINHAWPFFLNVDQKYNYRLLHSFYDIALTNSPVWLLLGKNNTESHFKLKQLSGSDIISGNVTQRPNGFVAHGNQIKIALPKGTLSRIILGIKCTHEQQNIHLAMYSGDSILLQSEQMILPIEKQTGVSKFTQEIQVLLPEGTIDQDAQLFLLIEAKQNIDVITPFAEYAINQSGTKPVM